MLKNINHQFDEYGFTCFSSSSTWSQLVPRQPFLRLTSVKKGKTNIFSLVSGNRCCCCWMLVHVSAKYIFPDIWPADTNKLSDLQIHVPDTQKPCPEQLGSWQSTAKKERNIYCRLGKNIFFINNLLLFSFHNKSLALLLGWWKITTFQKRSNQAIFLWSKLDREKCWRNVLSNGNNKVGY